MFQGAGHLDPPAQPTLASIRLEQEMLHVRAQASPPRKEGSLSTPCQIPRCGRPQDPVRSVRELYGDVCMSLNTVRSMRAGLAQSLALGLHPTVAAGQRDGISPA